MHHAGRDQSVPSAGGPRLRQGRRHQLLQLVPCREGVPARRLDQGQVPVQGQGGVAVRAQAGVRVPAVAVAAAAVAQPAAALALAATFLAVATAAVQGQHDHAVRPEL